MPNGRELIVLASAFQLNLSVFKSGTVTKLIVKVIMDLALPQDKQTN